jgi:pimeloyl-ACP methyl ester carboxylesterase
MKVRTGPVELAYETFGRPGDPAVVLVMGLGTQMIAWPDEFCRHIADSGRFVVRYDNRDIGLSTHLSDLPAPRPPAVLFRREPAPYSISDMAHDLLGLMDALGLPNADVVGASMGGFISQSFALHAPERVRSLTLIMTSTGSRRVGNAAPRAFGPAIFRRPPADASAAVEASIATFRRIGSPGFPFDEAAVRSLAERSVERSFDPDGVLRQLAACLRQPNRTPGLTRLRIPTVVMHGLADPLVGVSGGLALARAIPGAKFIGFAGMGHDLPRPLWPTFVDEITALSQASLTGG